MVTTREDRFSLNLVAKFIGFVDGKYKLIRKVGAEVQYELYNLEMDPTENRNIAAREE